LAESAGIQALAVHGRTRADRFNGVAEYQTIRQIKLAVSIPVVANGDVDSPEKAAEVLDVTGADAIMIGRAAQGRPWIFEQVAAYLNQGLRLPDPNAKRVGQILLAHLDALYHFYGERQGVRVARKHIRWYCSSHLDSAAFWARVCRAETSREQYRTVEAFFVGKVAKEDATPRAA
jgi:tRNA-dihydrouridine synthase B